MNLDNSNHGICKIKQPTQIYIKYAGQIYFLGTSTLLNNVEKFNLNTNCEKLISPYKIHDIFEEGKDFDISYSQSLDFDVLIKQTIIARNYIWDINEGCLSGFKYTILRDANIFKLKDGRIKVESKIMDREEKYIYLY